VTPRGLVDCLVATIAWRHGAHLLAHDVDLDRVARVIGVPMDEASLRAGE
jgi:predicted nucleic acid-binding protein